MDPPDLALLTSLKLQTIIDLRTHAEASQSTTVATLAPQVLQIPLFEVARDNWVAPTDQSPPATAARYFEMLADGTDSFIQVVQALAHSSAAPFVLCCAAGRDRTGIVVACLLDLLGVKDDANASDYARSDDFIQDGGRAHAETVLELLKLIRDQFGSTQDLLQARGLTSDTFLALRRNLLVSMRFGSGVPAAPSR